MAFTTPKGLFTKPAKEIADTLLREGKKKADKRITFYMNRAGKNLHPATMRKIKEAKRMIASATGRVASNIHRNSQITRKAPDKRLVKRREKPEVKGYFPNPSTGYIIYSDDYSERVYYVHGTVADTKEICATIFHTMTIAETVKKEIEKITHKTFHVSSLKKKD